MTPRRHRLRRTPVILVGIGLAFAGLAPSALAATGESEDTPATRGAIADASTAREPTTAAAGVTDAAGEAAERGPTALGVSDAHGDSSVDRGAPTRDRRTDDSPGPTDSAGNEDGESSVGRAVRQGTSDVRAQTRTVEEKAETTVTPAARRATRTVRQRAEPVAKKARAGVRHGIDRVRGKAPSEPTADAGHRATTAPAASEPRPRVDSSREPSGRREAPGPGRLVTRLVEPLVPIPATAASAPPARRRLASAALRPSEVGLREDAAPRASATRAPVRLDPLDSAVAPAGDPGPSDGSSSAPGGGLSSASLMFGGAAAMIAAFCLTAPSLLQRLRASPALVRPVAFASLLERPG